MVSKLIDPKYHRFWFKKMYRRAVQFVGSRLYFDTSRDTRRSVFVAGTARSGTTWLGELISAQTPCRMMFEPFNNNRVDKYRNFQYFQYMRVGQQNNALHEFAKKVFSGEIRSHWIDRKNESIFPSLRIVKEIRANLLLKWLHDKFPEVPLLFMIRHPCAVVLSRMELGWATDTDIESFLQQPDLIDDFLSPFMDIIKNAQTDEEKHAIIWCVSNLVPLKQFQTNELKIVYYESLCTQPENELSRVLSNIQQVNVPLRPVKTDIPSTTSNVRSAVVSGKDKISRWQSALSIEQTGRIQKIVSMFGLDYLYGDTLVPYAQNS